MAIVVIRCTELITRKDQKAIKCDVKERSRVYSEASLMLHALALSEL
jgi:hypothetical protein